MHVCPATRSHLIVKDGFQNNVGETVKTNVWVVGSILAVLGYFRNFCLNSGGRELPGVMAEIDCCYK